MMDVRELAPALLSVGDACDQANRVLNGDGVKVSVQVRSGFEHGSFGLDLDLVQTIQQALLGDEYRTAKEVLWLLGLGVGPGAGLLAFIKWLRGRKATVGTKNPDGSVQISVNDSEGTKIENTTINASVVVLFNNPSVRRAISGMVGPLEDKGIDTFEAREGNQVIQSISKSDLPFFSLPSDQEDLVSDQTREGVFQIDKLSFTDRYKWTLSDGNATFNAHIADDDFFTKVERREYSFAHGDLLEVKLQIKTFRSPKGLRSDYIVMKVTDVIHAPEQLPLLPFDPSATRSRPGSKRGRKGRPPSRG